MASKLLGTILGLVMPARIAVDIKTTHLGGGRATTTFTVVGFTALDLPGDHRYVTSHGDVIYYNENHDPRVGAFSVVLRDGDSILYVTDDTAGEIIYTVIDCIPGWNDRVRAMRCNTEAPAKPVRIHVSIKMIYALQDLMTKELARTAQPVMDDKDSSPAPARGQSED